MRCSAASPAMPSIWRCRTATTPEESGPFQLFLTGQPDDYAWHQPCLDLVRDATAAGRTITRVRVVSVPHVDYTR